MINGNTNLNAARLRRLCGAVTLLLLLLGSKEVSATNYIVRMQGTRFVPRDSVISVGDSITWTNLDFTGHDSTSGTNGVPSGFWRTPLFGFGGSATVTFTNIPPGSYGYYCTPHVFVGMVGSVTVLPGNAPPVAQIIEPADGALVAAGTPLQIVADATDSDGRIVRVDFFVDGSLLSSDSLGPFLATYANPTIGNHSLRVVAVDDRGATSTPVSVNIMALAPPSIVTPPSSVNTFLGGQATFDVVAQGASPLSFQWQLNGNDILGATNTSYTVNPVTTADAGRYTVTIRNAVGEITSPPVTLTLSNALPVIEQIVSPLEGAKFPSGANVPVLVEANDLDGTVSQVEFRLDGDLEAVTTNSPWSATLTNLANGQHIIEVVAVDDQGARGDASNRTIQVFAPPAVSITQPANGSVFTQLNTIVLRADLVSGAAVTNVGFFAGDFMLGAVAPAPITNSGPVLFVWQPTALGNHSLIAVATDEFGQRGTSAPVVVTIYDPADTTRPAISLASSESNFARVSKTNVVWLTGTAADNQGLSRVELFMTNQFSGGINVLSGTTDWYSLGDLPPGTRSVNWHASITLPAGQNTLLVRSVDLATNFSLLLTRYFTYAVNARLVVSTSGDGSFSPNLDGRLLEIGKTYRLTARPSRGQIFDRWEGAVSQGPVVDFVMSPGLALTAYFDPNPFAGLTGGYAGLIQDTNIFAAAGNGLLTLEVSENGSFSGRLRTAAGNHSFRGLFDQQGHGRASVLQPPASPIVLDMHLGLTDVPETIRGRATNGFWVADLLCYRNPFATGTNLWPQAGSRIFAWHDQAGSNLVALSSLTVSTRGKANMTASFVDGRRCTAASSVSRDGYVPVAFLPGGNDSLVGWARVSPTDDPTVQGTGNLILSGTNTRSVALIITTPGSGARPTK